MAKNKRKGKKETEKPEDSPKTTTSMEDAMLERNKPRRPANLITASSMEDAMFED